MSCGVGCRRSSDLALLWPWCRLAAMAPIRPLAWEPPYTMGVASEKRQKKKKKKKESKLTVLEPERVKEAEAGSVRVSTEGPTTTERL